MKEFDNSKIIHTLNKTMEKHLPEQWKTTIESKNNALLLGDLIEDLKMIPNDKIPDAVTVGFLEKYIEENLEKYRQNFDVVLTRRKC